MVDGSWLDGSTVLEATPTDNGEGVPKRVFLVITFSRGMPIPVGGLLPYWTWKYTTGVLLSSMGGVL